jgi:ABC-2 type transport system permease protein
LEALVSGISNDIGRTIEMHGRGEMVADESRFNDDPIFAVFRFLDLEFIFQIVLSLFAILFVYDAINGEKERGTLRLSFANALPRDKFILGKLIGSFISLAIPLLVPILVGCLLLFVLDIHFTSDDWIKFGLVILAGFLYFGVFLMLSIFISSVTSRSTSSFLMLLVIWIFSVLIIPRSSVLLAGRAVDVPSIDEMNYQKSKQRSQLWKEDRNKMSEFKPTNSEDPNKMVEQFNEFMQNLSDERDKKMKEFSARLNENRLNKQIQQERVAFGLSRISPSATFSLAATNLVGTSIDLKQHFMDEVIGYQQTFGEFMKKKTGMKLGGGMIIMRMSVGDEEEKKPIDPNELPSFQYHALSLGDVINNSLFDIGLLALYNLVFFIGAIVAFLRYDLR